MGFLSGVSSFIEKHSEAVHAVPDIATSCWCSGRYCQHSTVYT